MCIQENNGNFHRYDWCIPFVTYCTIHEIYLEEKCHSCKKSIVIWDVVVGKCMACDKNLSSQKKNQLNQLEDMT